MHRPCRRHVLAVSPQAHAIAALTLVLFAVCAVIFAIVAALVTYAAIRFRRRAPAGDPHQAFGNMRVEVLWTAAPLVLLIIIFGLTVRTMRASDPETPDRQTPDLVLIGHQWWWEARYPHDGVVTANEIHIPIGKRLLVELSSADVVHDFWVPQLGRKMDMVPGHPTRLWIESDTAGTFGGTCAEYCGAEHAWMRLRVVAEADAAFADWVAAEQRSAPAPNAGAALDGARLFTSLTCASCHAIAGTGNRTTIGPDLTHVASRKMLAGELIANTPEGLGRWLEHPDLLKPGSHMPNVHLSRDQIASLVAYLETLR
jgi:cytochrome c oxidase subunit II